MPKKAPVSAVQQLTAKEVALLVWVLALIVAPHLKAQTSVTYPVGSSPEGIAFDGANIWVANANDDTVTKLLASTGATVGTYHVGTSPFGVAFDGTNIWVTNSQSNTVTKLLAATGATVGTYTVGPYPTGIAFDGTNMWVTNSAYQQGASGTVTKLLASTGANAGTYTVGTSPEGIAFDGANIWVANVASGTVTKLLAATGATVGTYAVGAFPGNGPNAVAFDGAYIWVANWVSDTVTKLLASTGATVGTYAVGTLPGNTSSGEAPDGIAFDGANIWVTSANTWHAFTVTKLRASTGANAGTYTVGTSPEGIAFDGANVWVTDGVYNTVTKISDANPEQSPYISPGGIVPLDGTSSIVQPGEWISIWGGNLASATTVWNGNFATSLGGTSVQIDGKAAYPSFVSPRQINLQVPDDTTNITVPVVVTTAIGTVSSTVILGQFGPSFALLDAKHVAGIILRSNGSGAYGGGTYDILGPTGSSLGYPTVAAKAGDTIELFAVGLGPTNPAVPAGQVFSGKAPTTNPINLLINNVSVTPSFAGLSSAGLYQINLTVPAGLGTGDLTLVATVSRNPTQTGVAISLQ